MLQLIFRSSNSLEAPAFSGWPRQIASCAGRRTVAFPILLLCLVFGFLGVQAAGVDS